MIYGDNPGENPMPSMAAIQQSSNLYVYCGNDPINRIDPTGETYGYMTDYAKKIGASVFWNASTSTATITRNGENYDYVIKDGQVYLNGNNVGYIYNNKIYLDDLIFYRDTGGYDNTAIAQVYYTDMYGRTYTDEAAAEKAKAADDKMREFIDEATINTALMGGGIKIVGGNAMANSIAQKFGYEGAEALKADFVGKSGSLFNMMYDTKTGEIILQSIKDSAVKVFTGLFR